MFLELTNRLKRSGIAHGDLQHGYIIVIGEGLRLVDYDGMFVPWMERMLSSELGHRNYQHPKRHPEKFSVVVRDSANKVAASCHAAVGEVHQADGRLTVLGQ